MAQALDVEFRAYVHDAAIALDRLRPEWYRLIDVAALDMKSLDACVLGQVFRPRGWRRLFTLDSGYGIGSRKTDKIPGLYGPVFASPRFQGYWVEEIAARLFPVFEQPVLVDAVDPVDEKVTG